MPIMLTAVATLVFIALWPALANIWDVPQFNYIVARWAIALWVLTLDAALWFGVYWTYQ